MTTVSSTSGSTSSTSIAQTLGAGSGIDIKSLVANLVDAQFAAKNSQLTKQSDALTAQISSIGKLSQGITAFRDALKSLVQGGSLRTQPTSSNTSVATVTLQKGASAIGLSAQLSVQQVAANQAATSNSAIGTTQAFRGGTLTVKIGSYVTANGATTLSPATTVPVTIADGATVDQIAAQITKATGLQTALIKDNGGVRLTIKGATGAAQAFEIAGADTDPSGAGQSLSTLAVGPGATGMTVGSTAKDAIVTLDGAQFTRPGNAISDLLPGVDLNILTTSSTPVTIGASPPGSALTAAVEDVVDTFNALKSIINTERNSVDGALRTDTAASALDRMLGQLTLTKLTTSTTGGPQTLADLGIGTDTDKRDGSLKLDSAKLASVMATNPAGVEAIFATDASDKGGLLTAITDIATKATDKTFGLGASTARYTKATADIATQQSKATADATAMSTRMTQQYAAMDARVAAYKASQSFLEQQIKVWTKSDS